MGGTSTELKTDRETGESRRRGPLLCLTARGELFMSDLLSLHLYLGGIEHICHRAASGHENGQCLPGPERPQGQHYQLPDASTDAAREGLRATPQLCCLKEQQGKKRFAGVTSSKALGEAGAELALPCPYQRLLLLCCCSSCSSCEGSQDWEPNPEAQQVAPQGKGSAWSLFGLCFSFFLIRESWNETMTREASVTLPINGHLVSHQAGLWQVSGCSAAM